MLRPFLLGMLLIVPSASVNVGILSPQRVVRAALGVASQGMGLAKPLFAVETKLQADILGDEQTKADAAATLDEECASAPVVIYTYGLSPFSTEAIKFLDATGCKYKKIELGLEWFLLDGKASCIRALLLERTGQSSLPHVFVDGKSVGGLYSGAPGLVPLKQAGELNKLLRDAGAL